VINRETYLSPKIAGTIIRDYLRKIPGKDSVFSVLTSWEREVLQLLAEGKTTKEMSHALNLSTKTVETYRQNIMDKLGIHSIAELTKYAIREGLTSIES